MRLWSPSWLRQRSASTREQSPAQDEVLPSLRLWHYARAFVESTSECVFFLDANWPTAVKRDATQAWIPAFAGMTAQETTASLDLRICEDDGSRNSAA